LKINEVMRETGLTKKAIYYYEKEGLICPKKNPKNNYRHYTKDDVGKLIKISALRRLDVPIKTISYIISHEVPVREIMKQQLTLMNKKINILYSNKAAINDLMAKRQDESDFPPEVLKELNTRLDDIRFGSDDLGKEIERNFPGYLGKIFTIFYNGFLNVSLDTDEKVDVWKKLILKLDDMKEVEYPDDIRKIIDELHYEIERKRMGFHYNSGTLSRNNELSTHPQEWDDYLKEMDEYYTVGYDREKYAEGFYLLQNFILGNLIELKELGMYIEILNNRKNKEQL